MAARPNIVLIYTDQQRHDTIHALGAHWMATPALNRLASEGTSFTAATTPSPVCMPARWSLHTGMWSSNHRCYSNHHPGQRPDHDLPNLLRKAGYRTGLIGKNHSFLTDADFDSWQPTPEKDDGENRELEDRWIRDVRSIKYPRLATEPIPVSAQTCREAAKTAAALEFIESSGDSPFFLWLSYLYPHTPYEAPEPHFSQYAKTDFPEPVKEPNGLREKPFRQQFHQLNNDRILPFDHKQTMLMRQIYYGMISFIDDQVSHIYDFLREQDMLENTLIIFTSDHGDYMGDHGLYTKSPALYDCLVRIPMIMRWPATVPVGYKCDWNVSAVDLLPTICDVAQVDIPDQVDGVSLIAHVKNDNHIDPIRPVAFSEYGVPGKSYTHQRLVDEGLDSTPFTNPWDDSLPWEGNPVSLAGRIRMVRSSQWKLIADGDGGELYNMQSDPHELQNLFDSSVHSTIKEHLAEELNKITNTMQIQPEDT